MPFGDANIGQFVIPVQAESSVLSISLPREVTGFPPARE
jgi:hypothetical protein